MVLQDTGPPQQIVKHFAHLGLAGRRQRLAPNQQQIPAWRHGRLANSGGFAQQAFGPVAIYCRAHPLAGDKPKAGPCVWRRPFGAVAAGLLQLGRPALPGHQNDKRVGV